MENPLTDTAEMASKQNGETCPGRQADRVSEGKKASHYLDNRPRKGAHESSRSLFQPQEKAPVDQNLASSQQNVQTWLDFLPRAPRGFFGLNDRVGSFSP